MSVLSWGKPTIKTAVSNSGTPGSFTAIETPKEGTTKLTATAGTEKTAIEEGGEIVDVKYTKSTYELEFQIFVKKGGTLPFDDEDGLVPGEHAFQIIPEDSTCPGIQIDRAHVRCETNYTSEDGILQTVKAKALKPATGKMVKILSEGITS